MIIENTAPKNVDARETRAERTIRLLTTTATAPLQQKLQEFRIFYPAVATARLKGMRNKQILKILADGGLKLYPALLEKLIAAMERTEGVPTCQHCGQTLETEVADTNAGSPGPTDDEHPSEPPSGPV